MKLVYRPLPAIWPSGQRTPAHERRSAIFRAKWTQTIKELERELGQLGALDPIVVEAGFKEAEIRVDGLPRAGARPADPAIVLSFESKFGPLRYGCDAFTWYEANLRAIALALEALRKVDRYGVTKRGEQYKGWLALPEYTLSHKEAEQFIWDNAPIQLPGVTGDRSRDWPLLYRRAAKALHPDNPETGDRELWEELQRAKMVLGL